VSYLEALTLKMPLITKIITIQLIIKIISIERTDNTVHIENESDCNAVLFPQ